MGTLGVAGSSRSAGVVLARERQEQLDHIFMARALELARRGLGRTEPNLAVGCVIVRDGRILGEGYHRRAGAPHAEIEAIAAAGGEVAVRGATVYVTLEPCCHYGRTPPCTDALIRAGVARVVCATLDPNPAVSGQGVEQLRRAGIQVEVGLLEEEARRLNEVYFTWRERRRPFVALKYAMTLDGRAATRTGDGRWITGEAARARTHRLRDRYPAILVGVGTVLRDDPLLNCRLPGGRDPVRVVLDTRARTPPSARVLRSSASAPALVFVGLRADPVAVQRLQEAGAEVIAVPEEGGRVSLHAVLAELDRRGLIGVLVEGGPTVHAAFLAAGLADKLYAFVGGCLLGDGAAPGPVAGLPQPPLLMAQAPRWQVQAVELLEGDALLVAYPSPAGSADGATSGAAAPKREGTG